MLTLCHQLADRSVAQLGRNGHDRYVAKLSARLDTHSGPLARWISGVPEQQRHPPIRGAFFAPYPPKADRVGDTPSHADSPLWRHLGEAARAEPGRRVGWHPVTVFSMLALAVIGVWTSGMLVSGLDHARELHLTKQALQTLDAAPDPAVRLRALLALQQRIDLYEHRTRHPARRATGFG